MTRAEWFEVCRKVNAWWPRRFGWEKPTQAEYFNMLQEFDAEQVIDAFRSAQYEGEEYPPTGGMIRQRVLSFSSPDFDVALKLTMKVIGRHGGPYGRKSEMVAELEERDPRAAEFLSRVTVEELMREHQNRTAYAQWREIYRSIERSSVTERPVLRERTDSQPRKLDAANLLGER